MYAKLTIINSEMSFQVCKINQEKVKWDVVLKLNENLLSSLKIVCLVEKNQLNHHNFKIFISF